MGHELDLSAGKRTSRRFERELVGPAQIALRNWGRWSNIREYDGQASVNSIWSRGGGADPPITDDEALQIDFLVQTVKVKY